MFLHHLSLAHVACIMDFIVSPIARFELPLNHFEDQLNWRWREVVSEPNLWNHYEWISALPIEKASDKLWVGRDWQHLPCPNCRVRPSGHVSEWSVWCLCNPQGNLGKLYHLGQHGVKKTKSGAWGLWNFPSFTRRPSTKFCPRYHMFPYHQTPK